MIHIDPSIIDQRINSILRPLYLCHEPLDAFIIGNVELRVLYLRSSRLIRIEMKIVTGTRGSVEDDGLGEGEDASADGFTDSSVLFRGKVERSEKSWEWRASLLLQILRQLVALT